MQNKNKNIYTVEQINRYIKNAFSADYFLQNICVKGEVSNCTYHSSGHIYFTLKDQNSTLKAIMFAGNRSGLSFQMKDGDQVEVAGSVSVYEKGGTYQLYARKVDLQGEGDLYHKYEELKTRLEEMGMFADEYKKPIPRYVKTVGVVTAKTGAAIQDIRNITSRRNPYVQILLYPALVQGEGAAESIVEGIRTLDAMGLDVLIVGRGGGSIEDLWAFNEEPVVRAVFECETPVISAVGHEVDTTLCDYAADRRAPTPSAAAEIAVYDYRDVLQDLMGYEAQLKKEWQRIFSEKQHKLTLLQQKVKMLSPEVKLANQKKVLQELQVRLQFLYQKKYEASKHQLQLYAERLEGLSPMRKLASGYGFVTSHGEMVKDVHEVQEGDDIRVTLTNGWMEAKVTKVEESRRS